MCIRDRRVGGWVDLRGWLHNGIVYRFGSACRETDKSERKTDHARMFVCICNTIKSLYTNAVSCLSCGIASSFWRWRWANAFRWDWPITLLTPNAHRHARAGKFFLKTRGYWCFRKSQSVNCHMGSHSVTCHPTQVNSPHLNPSQSSLYSIYLPRRDGRLSWWIELADYIWMWFTSRRQSPIRVAVLRMTWLRLTISWLQVQCHSH